MFAGDMRSSAALTPPSGGAGPCRIPPTEPRHPELRCTAPHPSAPSRICNGKLAYAKPGTVEVSQTGEMRDGCVVIPCFRCGTHYRVCPLPE
jgi:hypothetical protein